MSGDEYWYHNTDLRNIFKSYGPNLMGRMNGLFISPEIVSGDLDEVISQILPNIEGNKAFLISGSTTQKYAKEVGEKLEEAGWDYRLWTSEKSEAPLQDVMKCAEEMLEYEPELIIPVGGGSRIDLAKMAWIKYEKPTVDLSDVSPMLLLGLRKKAKMAVFPTTAGTGSEATLAAVGADDSHDPPKKLEVASLEIVPDYAALVPEFTAGMPPSITAGTGLDALTHAYDAYFSSLSRDITDFLSIKALKRIFEWLPKAYNNPDDMEARRMMLEASTLAGLSFGNCNAALTHSLGHAVGKVFGIHHGAAVGMFIPPTLRYYSKVTDKHVDMAKKLGIEANSEEEYLEKLEKKFMDLMDEIDIDYRLKEYDINPEEWENNLDRIAGYSESDICTLTSPRSTNKEELKKILKSAYEHKDVDF